jgi:redox-sensitive bicupin YhaK (pirin superfamily)
MKYFRRDFLKKTIFGIFGISIFGGLMKTIKANKNKKVKFIYTVGDKHWVGDGFHVHGLLRPSEELNKFISPFILMDYASPEAFPKTKTPKGVGSHPHRGFETVTFAFQGEVEHRDSFGGGGVIKPGDVQWMTAGSGLVHDEFHSKEFCAKGGVFEMVQLWVNLPKKDKMSTPKYQGIKDADIPNVKVNDSTQIRVIAGDYAGTKGPSSTFTPINIYDIKSKTSEKLSLDLKEGTNTILLILDGEIEMEEMNYKKQSVLIFDQLGESIDFKTSPNFKGLLLNGEPIDEPMVAHGPFVMNTKQEINEAINDFQSGKMGTI